MACSTSECKHRNLLFIQSRGSTGIGLSYRDNIYLCADCGQFQINVTKNGVHSRIVFALCTAEMVIAAGQYVRFLTEPESEAHDGL